MSADSVTSNLFKITRLRSVNAYLVREDDGFTLVDALIPGSAGGILAEAERAGAPIRRMAFTHGHTDHVGSLDALKQQLPDVEVLMPETDARIHAGEDVTGGKKPPGSWPKLKTTPDVRLQPGDRVGSLEVIPTPGHTPGHVSFLDTRDRAVIVGDVMTSIGGLAVSNHFHLPFPFAAIATWDKAKDLDSAKVIRDLNPSVLVVGHGGPVKDPQSALDKAIRAAGG